MLDFRIMVQVLIFFKNQLLGQNQDLYHPDPLPKWCTQQCRANDLAVQWKCQMLHPSLIFLWKKENTISKNLVCHFRIIFKVLKVCYYQVSSPKEIHQLNVFLRICQIWIRLLSSVILYVISGHSKRKEPVFCCFMFFVLPYFQFHSIRQSSMVIMKFWQSFPELLVWKWKQQIRTTAMVLWKQVSNLEHE